ncbi:MAG: HU family DNA-binding protein [Akkermansia sp.]|nr:HU family DNA-binding protein [Akkermansia sp.]
MGPGATRATASAAVEAVLASIRQATAESGDKLHIAHFGTFQRTERSARQGYDINTGTMRPLPARQVLAFTPTKSLLP